MVEHTQFLVTGVFDHTQLKIILGLSFCVSKFMPNNQNDR